MNITTPTIEIIKDDRVNVDDLVRLQTAGFSVLRSAHIGNLSPYNLTLADAGLPILSVDHTITGVDTNYFPESINTQTGSTIIAPLGKLACRTKASTGEYLDELHLAAVQRNITNAKTFTNTEYLQANKPTIDEIVRVTLAEFPELFNRMALPDGSSQRQNDAAHFVTLLGVMQLNDQPRAEKQAVIMPNILNIAANFVIEALQSQQATQYHLSGAAMVKYIGTLMPTINQLYARLQQTASFGGSLPAHLTVRLVPTTPAKFATTVARAPKLDALLKTYQAASTALAELEERRRTFFGGSLAADTGAREQFVATAKSQQAAIEREVAGYIAEIPELFIEPGTPGFVTQYDVENEGGLYVPAINRTASMAQLAAMSHKLTLIKKRLVRC
jgi:hypothetical protein